MALEIDIGHEHYMRYFGWHPDDSPGNRERYGKPLPSVDKAGINIRHRPKDPGYIFTQDGWCLGSVYFDIPEMYLMRDKGPWWKVENWNPLTLAPSILCKCGDHGHIVNGRWQPS